MSQILWVPPPPPLPPPLSCKKVTFTHVFQVQNRRKILSGKTIPSHQMSSIRTHLRHWKWHQLQETRLAKHTGTSKSRNGRRSCDGSSDDETELCQDILAINTVFVCRMQGKRSARYRRERKEQQQKTQEAIEVTRRSKRQKKADLTRSLKNRVYPNSSQKTLLKQWMGRARLVYNMIAANFNHGHLSTQQFWFRSLREWNFMKDCPYQDNQQTITIHKNPLLFPLHHEHRRKNHNWPNLEGKVLMDSKLIFNKKLNYWTFVWVYVKNCNNINVENCDESQVIENLNVVAIDPGVRTGWSWYSPSKGCGWFGNLDINRIIRLSLSLDDLISRTTCAPPTKRNSMKRAQAHLRLRIQNLINECHK
ncbi:hypothetical protein C1646_755048 [Rhizophagus diaphanus]|nr:hypothetical protein C1646_755048 [Rhizophagus diaphanus] [Rhizophagus sp. MUCL 43196]